MRNSFTHQKSYSTFSLQKVSEQISKSIHLGNALKLGAFKTLLVMVMAIITSSVFSQINIPGNGTITTTGTCSNTFYDAGGSGASYGNNQTGTSIICPTSTCSKIQATFTSFSTESGYDGLMIYNGPNTSSPLVPSNLAAGSNTTTAPANSFYGTNSPGTVVSTSPEGCLTFVFKSDVSNVGDFAATISCVNNPIPAPPSLSNTGPKCAGNTVNLTANGLAPGIAYANYTGAQAGSNTFTTVVSNTFTVDFWVNPTSTITSQPQSNSSAVGTSGQRYAVMPGQAGTNGGMGVSVGTNGIQVYEHGNGYLAPLLVYMRPIPSGVWTHIAVVYNAKTPSLYLNGALVATGLTSAKTNVYPSIGTGGTSTGYGNFIGGIDNYRIWSGALTQAEIIAASRLESSAASGSGKTVLYRNDFNNTTTPVTGSGAWDSPSSYATPALYTYTWSGTGAPGASTAQTQTTSALSASQNYTVVASYSTTTVTSTEVICGGSTSGTNAVTINPVPTITPGTVSTVCAGATSFTIPYTSSGAPTTYSIGTPSPTISGFSTVTNAALPASNITVSIPIATSNGTYTFPLTVSNGTCSSTTSNVSVTVATNPGNPWGTAPNYGDGSFGGCGGGEAAISPTCGAKTLLVPNNSYTGVSLMSGRSYTFSSNQPAGWGTPVVAIYYSTNSGSTWVLGTYGNNSITYTAPASPGTSYFYRVTVWNGGLCSSTSSANYATLTYQENGTSAPSVPGNGSGVWNVLGYEGMDLNAGGSLVFKGYYTISGLSYNTSVSGSGDYNGLGSPSYAASWSGCNLNVNTHTVIAKRTGFTCGLYQIDVPTHDDEARLYLNGSVLWSHEGSCCDAHTNLQAGANGGTVSPGGVYGAAVTSSAFVWLNSSDVLEMRHTEGCGGSNQGLTFTDKTSTVTAIAGGSIGGIANGATICLAGDPGAFTNAGTPTGGSPSVGLNAGSYQYQWEVSYNSGAYGNVAGGSGATTAAFDPNSATFASGAGNYDFRRKVTDSKCGGVAYSNVLRVVVYPTPTATISGTTTICIGNTAPNITFTNSTAFPVTVTYNINGSGSNTVNIGASTSATVAASTASLGTFTYNLVSVAYQGGTACTNTISGSATVTVVDAPVITQQPASVSLCPAVTTANFSVIATGGTGSYQWQYNNAGTWTNLTDGVWGVSGATTANLLFTSPLTNLGAGTWTLRCIVNGSGCSTTSNSATFNVWGIINASAVGSDQTPCNNGTGSVTLTRSGGSGVANFNYIWSNGTTTQNLSGVYSGTYKVTVTDVNCPGLSATASASVTAPWTAKAGLFQAPCTNPVYLTAVTLPSLASLPGSGSASPGLSIPDNNSTGVSSGIAVQSCLNANQITSVTVNITHTWDGDLTLTLIAPNGSSVILSQGNGGSGDNYTGTVFTTGGTAITSGAAPFTGTYAPQNPFSGFTGTAAGTWTLKVQDLAGSDVGILSSWSIAVGTATSCDPVYTWSSASGLSSNSTNLSTSLAGPYTLNVAYLGCTSTDVVTPVTTITAPNISVSPTTTCNNGTATLTAWNMAPSGKVATFNGTNSITSALLSYKDNFTTEFWVKPGATRTSTTQVNSGSTSTSGQQFAIVPAGTSVSTEAGVGVSVGTNGISVFENAAGTYQSLLVYDFPVTYTDWIHVAVVYTAKTPTLYINGSYIKQGLTSSKTSCWAAIGTGYTVGAFTGSIDNIRLWNTPRLPVEIKNDMYKEAPSSTSGLMGWYTFNNSNTNSNGYGSNLTGNSVSYTDANYFTYTWTGTGAPTPATTSESRAITLTNSGSSNITNTYNVSATAGGCSGTSSSPGASIIVSPTLAAPGDITLSQCSNSTYNYNVTLTASAGADQVEISQNTSFSPSSGVVTSPYTATLAVNSGSTATYYYRSRNSVTGCVGGYSTITLTVNPLPATPTASVTAQPSCTVPSGTITVTAPTGANINYSITGSSYQSSGTFTGVNPGGYTVTAKNTTTGCISSGTGVTVNAAPTPPSAPTASVTAQPTCSVSTGTITVTAPTGANIQYSIDGTNYQTSGTFTGVASGTYNVTAKNTTNTCVSTATSVTVNTAPSVPAAPTASVTTQPSCAVSTGTITITAPTGANIQYSIDGTNYQASATFTGVAPGTYNVTAKNTTSTCVSTATSLTVNAAPAVPSAPTASVTTQPSCSVPTGTITVTAPTGANIQYSIDGTNYQASGTFAGVAPGTYSVTAKNTTSTCVSSATSVTVNAAPSVPAAPTASVTAQPTCNTATGTITVTAPTGANIQYSIDGTNYQASGTFSSVVAGTYSVTAKNTSSGCISLNTSVTVNAQPSVPTAPTASVTAQPSCSVATGTITITAPTGANINYSIDGTTYQAGTTFTSVAPGTYNVTTKNTTSGCVSTATSLTVNAQPSVPAVPTASATAQPTCSVATGTITVTAPTGANIQYSIDGTNYQASGTFSTVAPGTYSVTAKNTTSTCVSAATSVTINAAPAVPATPTASVTAQPTCSVPTGTITVTAPTGANINYSINGTTYQASTSFTSVAPGTYSLTAKNTTSGCVSSAISLTVNAAPSVPATPTASATSQPTCALATGTITVTAPTGANINYSIDGSTYQASGTFNTVNPGTYTVTAKNTSSGCVSAGTSVTINPQPNVPATPTASATAQPTCTVATGTITVTAPTGANITYSINGTNYQAGGTFNTVSPGTYSVTAKNTSTGCVSPAASVIINPQPAIPSAPTVNVTQPGCVTTTGTITVTSPTGAVYNYSINGTTYQSSVSFSGLTTGSYNVTVKNTSSTCVSPVTSATVNPIPTPPTTPVATVTVQPTCAVPSGTIVVSSPVGVAYEYSLDGGTYQASATFTGVAVGSHTVTARLAASTDCISPASGTLTVNATPTPLVTNPVVICQGGSGSLTVDPSSVCVQNFVVPTIPGPNTLYGGWLSSSPTANTLSGASNTTVCSFTGASRSYSAIQFQVTVTGNYIFEMNANANYDGAGYIVTGNFTPGTCSGGTLVRADNASGSGGEPKLGSVGTPMTLTAGITYTLISTTDGASNVINNDYTWTVTPPSGGDVLINQPGTVEWYTASSGGSPIGSGTSFNPVGVAGSGLTNTNSQGTYTYWAACSSSPSCRTQADFVISTNVTIHTVTPGGESCYDAGTPVSVGLNNSTNGSSYQLFRDGVAVGSAVTGTGTALSVGNTSTPGTYTVSVNAGTCNVPMNGSVEIKPLPIADAGTDVTLPCSSSVTLNATSNNTTLFTEGFGTGVNNEVTTTTSGWRVKYLYGTEPNNRTEWWISYSGASPYNFSCANSGSALTLVDHRIYQSPMPCDYAWDAGTMDEIAYNTTPIDARLYTTVNLSFNYLVGGTAVGTNVYDYLQVMYSLDNGATWVPVSAGNNAGTYSLYRGMGSTNAFFAATPTNGTANITMPGAVAGKKFLLGFRWVNDGDLTGAYVGGPMVDNISVTGSASYSWTPTFGVTGGNTASPVITQSGTYTVFVTAGNGCSSSDQVVVTAASAPSVSISGYQDVCTGGSTTLTANISGGTGTVTNVLWERSANNGGSWSTVQSNATTTYATSTSLGAGNYLYRATAYMSSNCNNTSANVSANVKADPLITDDPDDVFLCSGGTAVMNIAASGGTPTLQYEWQYDDATTVNNNNPSGVTYTGATTTDLTISTSNSVAPTTIPLWVRVYASGPGCDETYTLFANLNILADPTVSNPTPATQNGLCVGATPAAISVNANGGIGSYNYQWYSNTTNSTSGGTLISGANNSTYSPPSTTGTTYYYCVVGQAGSGCGPVSTAATASVNVSTPVTANVVVDQCMNYALGDKYYVLVTGSGGTPPYTYPGAFYTSTTNQGIHELAAGTSSTYNVSDASGCTATSSPVTAPTGRPTDLPFTTTTGHITADCWINDYNRWVTFRDEITNNAIMAINDNHSNLGLVTVDVYKDATPPTIYNSSTAGSCPNTQFTAMRRHFKMSSTQAPTTGVDVMLFFTDDEYNTLKADAWNNNTGYPNPEYACTELDDVYNFSQIYVTKYTGANEDGNYLNNLPSGLYRVFGDNTTPNRPLIKGEHTGSNTGFQGIYGGNNTHHYVQMTVTEFSEFWLHGSQQHSTPLPVSMIYLQADAMNNAYIRLSWATATEVNNRGFEVERSTDGQNWTQIGFVDGHNNSTVQNNYSYDDMNVAAGIVYYYRLKQVDYDNAFEYTDIVSARITGETTFSVKEFVPNPTTDRTSLIVTGTKEQEINIAFYNVVGQKVLESSHVVNRGANTISFDLARLASGTYTAVVSSANEVYTQKIVLAR